LRGLELERLDALHAACWPAALAGHLRSIDTVLRIMRRRAALLGLDAPRRHHVTAEVPLQAFAAHAAERAGLDPAEVLAAAEQLLAQLTQNDE
jgi:hypothetical protein